MLPHNIAADQGRQELGHGHNRLVDAQNLPMAFIAAKPAHHCGQIRARQAVEKRV